MTATETRAYHATHRIGRDEDGGPVFVEVQITESDKGPKLSITGTTRHSSGQCTGDVRAVEDFAPGWDAAKRDRLCAIWDAYHLNDMTAGCEHQIGPDWEPVQIETRKYSIDWDDRRDLERIADADAARLLDGTGQAFDRFPPYRNAAELLRVLETLKIKPFSPVVLDEKTVDRLRSKFAIVAKYDRARYLGDARKRWELHRIIPKPILPPLLEETNRQWSTFVRPDEHPKGLLCKPCPTCGYKHGSAWNYRPIPEDVIAWLKGLEAPDPGVNPYDAMAAEFLAQHQITFSAVHAAEKMPPWNSAGTSKRQHWRVTFRHGRRSMTCDFYDSIASTADGEDLRAYSVLSSLASESFLEDPDQIAADYEMKPSDARRAAAFGRKVRRFFEPIGALEDLRSIS